MAINTSDSGEISVEELELAMPDLDQNEIKQIFENIGPGKTKIKWSEFQVACCPIQNPSSYNQLISCEDFSKMDQEIMKQLVQT